MKESLRYLKQEERELLAKHNLETLVYDSLLVTATIGYPSDLRRSELGNAKILIDYVESEEDTKLLYYNNLINRFYSKLYRRKNDK